MSNSDRERDVTTTTPTRYRIHGTSWLVLATCTLTNVWYRGPFFGLILLVVAVPPPLILTVILRRTRISRTAVVFAATLSSLAMAWFSTSPPSTARLFSVELGCPLPDDVEDLKRYDDSWGIDPYFCFRFRTSAAGMDDFVKCIPLSKKDASVHRLSTFEFSSGRSWWKPAEMTEPQVWLGRVRNNRNVELWYEPESGLVYLWLYAT